MRIVICGGRDYLDYDVINATLSDLHESHVLTEVIHGGASGADAVAGRWAALHRVTETVFPANWKNLGRRAGPIRNQQMCDEGPDAVVAFPGGAGTADMVRRAAKAGIPVVRPTLPSPSDDGRGK